jgi:type 1 glutamine amidotransferase
MRNSLCLILTLCLTLIALPCLAGESETAKPIRVLLTFGGHGFQQAPFFEMFDKLPGITYTKAPLPASAERLKPGLEREFDVIVSYDMVKDLKPVHRKAYVELLNSGIGLVALHHNLGAHRSWPEYARIIGGKYLFKAETIDGKAFKKSTYAHGQHMKITIVDQEHPITKGLKNFEIHDETYGGYYVADGVHVLMETDHPKCGKQIAWVKKYGKSRVFYFLLGHDAKAWANPAYPAVLKSGIQWAAQKD